MIIKVGPEGTITLPMNIIVRAVGRTPTELERDIRAAYVPALFVNCTPSVKAEERYFFVGGEVKVAGRLAYSSHTMTVLRAITTAGGFTDFAKKTKIEVRRSNGKTDHVNYNKALKDPKLDLPVFPGDEIVVPRGL
jgi:polysaccharide export outer membrane protein